MALSGQTLGMMIAELRVVDSRLSASASRAFWRYVAAALSTPLVLPMLIGLFLRVTAHDFVSGTRVVRSRLAR